MLIRNLCVLVVVRGSPVLLFTVKPENVTTPADAPLVKRMSIAREMAKLSKRDPHLARTKIAQLMDNVDTINTLAETVTSVEELTRKLEMLFNDEAGAASVMCSTVHKAKGLEADRVWVLEDTLKCGGLEEENIRYVAYTRARKELCLVSLLKGGSDARAVIDEICCNTLSTYSVTHHERLNKIASTFPETLISRKI